MPGSQPRPNVLLVMADQMRFDWMGCAGAGWVRTPSLDALARRGTRFATCVSNSPVCAPARIALATGLMPHRMGAADNHAFLPAFTHRTYYERLRDAGYWTACVGKLDLAKPDPMNGVRGERPQTFQWGFTHPTECEGKMHAGRECPGRPGPHGPYTHYLEAIGMRKAFQADYAAREAAGSPWACHDSVLPTEAFEDSFIGRRAAEWLDAAPDEFPWHMFVSFVGPHNPFDPPTEYAGRYRSAEMPPPIEDPLEGKPRWHGTRQRGHSAEFVAECRRQYSAAVELIDAEIGRVMSAVERRGWLDRTHVIFASDHGEMLGDHGMWTKGVAYEHSLRVPLIAAGPGLVAGAVSDALVELIDVNATICDLAGLPPQEGVDAASFRPVLEGRAEEHRAEVVSTHRGWSLLRTKRMKAVLNDHDLPELYDLEADTGELVNLARERPDEHRAMVGRMTRRMLSGECLR